MMSEQLRNTASGFLPLASGKQPCERSAWVCESYPGLFLCGKGEQPSRSFEL